MKFKQAHFVFVFVLLVGNYKDDTVFLSNREKLEKSFEAFSQVLDNFVAKVCNNSIIYFCCHSFLTAV